MAKHAISGRGRAALASAGRRLFAKGGKKVKAAAAAAMACKGTLWKKTGSGKRKPNAGKSKRGNCKRK